MQRKDIFNGRVTLPAPSTMTTYTAASVIDRRSTKVMITAVFTALALATNYALIGIPNVKIMDTLVFIAALFFGLRLGGLLSTFAYDALTNFGSWIFRTGSLYQDFVFGNIIGVPFSIAHEASNVIFFATIAPAIIVAATRLGLRTSPDAA